MTSPTEQMLREIKERLSAADMKQYARHPDYWEMAECELSAHAPEDLAKLIKIVEKMQRTLSAVITFEVPWTLEQERLGNRAIVKLCFHECDAIAKGDE